MEILIAVAFFFVVAFAAAIYSIGSKPTKIGGHDFTPIGSGSGSYVPHKISYEDVEKIVNLLKKQPELGILLNSEGRVLEMIGVQKVNLRD